MSALTLQVQRGSIEDDAVVRIEVACNDPGKARQLLAEAYAEAMAKLGVVLPPSAGEMPPDPRRGIRGV